MGFNLLGHGWVRRVLSAARCPVIVIEAIMSLLSHSEVILAFRRRRYDPVHLLCGLPQGGPLSALLFVLCADPLLCSLKAHEDVEIVLGYVDDWLCSTKNIEIMPSLQSICMTFAAASGLKFNL